MKILVFLTMLTLSFASVVNANILSVIAVYDFEVIDEDESGIYIASHSVHDIHGYLRKSTSLSNEGKYGKALSIRKKDYLRTVTEHIPLVNDEISIVAFVKVPPLKQKASVYLSLQRNSIDNARDFKTLAIQSTGNLKFTEIWTVAPPDLGAVFFSLESEDQNITDNNWHHVAYSYHLGIHRIFIDGELVFEEQFISPRIGGDFTTISIGNGNGNLLEGEVLIDDVGVFGTDFSVHEIQNIYNNGLKKFLQVVPVSPQGRLTTTWGDIKARR